MKNNTLAMLATISLVMSVAMLISYISPQVCAENGHTDLQTCTQVANERLLMIGGFFAFGAITLIGGAVRARIRDKRERLSRITSGK
jgi:hypothetical protein